MDKTVKVLLSALIEDAEESDGYFCFEIVEPYVNANSPRELSDREICQLLVSLVEKEAVYSYRREEQNGNEQYIPSKPTIANASSMWYQIAPNGRAMLNEGI